MALHFFPYFSPKIKLILTFHLFSAMALSNFWTNYTGQAIFCAVFGMTSGAYVRTHHMFSQILNFLFVIVFSRKITAILTFSILILCK